MENLQRIWTDTYPIQWFDADRNNRISMMSICRYLQESAWHHANHLGFGYMDDHRITHTWVIVRLLIRMHRFPAWEDVITVNTWPRGMEGMLAMRDFEILDSGGKRLGVATSQWFIIDTETRKPLPDVIDRDIVPLVTSAPVMEEQPEKILIKEPLDYLETYKAYYSHIDLYGHVNNTRYVEWIINSIPDGIHRELVIESFLIEFLSETRQDDEVQIFGKISSGEGIFRGVRTEDDKVIFRAKVKFRH